MPSSASLRGATVSGVVAARGIHHYRRRLCLGRQGNVVRRCSFCSKSSFCSFCS
ncbi:hypothetical protein SESBI_07816 [Sesbania bispinosa]|nr:hypothetical protein SESBI_07816 [Sesbania bispinosa]